MKIVHAADIHLDTPYVSRDEKLRRRLQDAGRDAFGNLVDLSIRERVDALVIAGDLFDNEFLTVATERRLTDEVCRLVDTGITVVYVTGNHDPGRANYRAMQINWPHTEFHLVNARQPVKIPLEREGQVVGWVVAAGHQTPRETTNLAATFPTAPEPEPSVALLHAHVAATQHAPEHEPYAPAAVNDFRNKGYAYWALGHIHKRQLVSDAPPAAYPGNLQGRNFRETGAKGALVVEIEPGIPATWRFEPLAPIRWERLTLDNLAEARTTVDIQTSARAAFSDLISQAQAAGELLPDQGWLLQVDLKGPCQLVDTFRREDEREALGSDLREELDVLDVEVRDAGLHRIIDLADYKGHMHVLGLALELAEKARSDVKLRRCLQPETLAAASAYFEGDDLDGYLEDLLTDMGMLVAEELLRKDRL